MLELADKELRQIEDQRKPRDLKRLAEIEDLAVKAIRAIPATKPAAAKHDTNGDGKRNRKKDQPNTLAARLANGSAHDDETDPTGDASHNADNGGEPVQSRAATSALLNQPAPHGSL